MSVFPQPVSRPEQVQLKKQMAQLVTENKALRNKVVNLEHNFML